MKEINLVYSGCSTLFYCHLGATKRLLEEYKVKEIVATSGGSIIGSLVACGYSYEQIERIVKSIKLKDMYDSNWIPFINKWGLIKGERIQKSIEEYIPFTFEQIDFPLNIVVSKLGSREPIYLNKKNNPKMKINDAIRASISIPILFDVFVLEGDKYVDGGLLNNFAIDYFRNNTIGIRIKSTYDKAKIPTNPIEYLQEILAMLMEAVENEHIEDAIYNQVITINTDRNGLSFNHSPTEINWMIKQGYEQTSIFLKENNKNNFREE